MSMGRQHTRRALFIIPLGPALSRADQCSQFSYRSGWMVLRSESTRPMLESIDALRERYDWKINFEEPPSRYRGDYLDVTSPKYVPKGPEDRAFGQKGGALAIRFPASSETEAPRDPEPALNLLVQAHNASGLPGRFTLRFVDGEFDIVPTHSVDESGVIREFASFLETKITLQAEGRNLVLLTRDVIAQLRQKTGATIEFGTFPINAFMQGRLDQNFTNAPARDVIRAIKNAARWTWAWSLLYDYGLDHYALNIMSVGQPRPLTNSPCTSQELLKLRDKP